MNLLGYNIGAQLAGQPGEERVPNHCLAEHPIFLPLGATMNYQRHYDLLINRARTRVLDGYKEKHHIIPRCVGGDDESSNLVDLTAEEHYVAHQLLVKMYPNNGKLIYALWGMTGNKRGCRWYGWAKKLLSDQISVRMIGNTWNIGRKHSEQTRLKIIAGLKTRKHTEESKRKIALSAIGNSRTLGMTHSEESKTLMSIAMKAVWAKRHSKGVIV